MDNNYETPPSAEPVLDQPKLDAIHFEEEEEECATVATDSDPVDKVGCSGAQDEVPTCDQGDEFYYPSFVHYEDDGIFEEHESVTVEGEMEQSCMYDDIPIFDHYEDDLTLDAESLLPMTENVETTGVHVSNEVLAKSNEPDHVSDLVPKMDKAVFVDCLPFPTPPIIPVPLLLPKEGKDRKSVV